MSTWARIDAALSADPRTSADWGRVRAMVLEAAAPGRLLGTLAATPVVAGAGAQTLPDAAVLPEVGK